MSDNNSSPNVAFSFTIVQINPDPGPLLQSVPHQTENIGGKSCFWGSSTPSFYFPTQYKYKLSTTQ